MDKDAIQRMLAGGQVLTDDQLERYRLLAICDDWHMKMVGSDVRMILGDLLRARAALRQAQSTDVGGEKH